MKLVGNRGTSLVRINCKRTRIGRYQFHCYLFVAELLHETLAQLPIQRAQPPWSKKTFATIIYNKLHDVSPFGAQFSCLFAQIDFRSIIWNCNYPPCFSIDSVYRSRSRDLSTLQSTYDSPFCTRSLMSIERRLCNRQNEIRAKLQSITEYNMLANRRCAFPRCFASRQFEWCLDLAI